MSIRNLFGLMAAVIFFTTFQASADIFDHFDDGLLDPAWEIVFDNATGWSYTESGTELAVSDIEILDDSDPSSSGKVLLRQSFPATGNFLVKCGLSWDSESASETMQTLSVRAYSGDTIVTQGGYEDAWITHSGEKYARIGDSLFYNSGWGTLPYSGSTEVTLKRKNGAISVLWNGEMMLTGFSDSVVDKLALQFDKKSYPGSDFGILSVDYVTAVPTPEPATILLLCIGSCCVLSRRKRV